MKLNCRPGDLAIWVTRGVIVEVLSVSRDCEIFLSTEGHKVLLDNSGGHGWRCRMAGAPQWMHSARPHVVFDELPIFDSSLRPIRDQPGDDETLSWTGRPKNRGVAAVAEYARKWAGEEAA